MLFLALMAALPDPPLPGPVRTPAVEACVDGLAVPQPLHDAVRAGDVGLMHELLATTPQPLLDPRGRTALHVAVEEDSGMSSLAVLRGLLEAGFDVDAPDFEGRTPRAMSASNQKLSDEIRRFLDRQNRDRIRSHIKFKTVIQPNSIASWGERSWPYRPDLREAATSPRLRAQRKMALIVEKGLYDVYWLHLVNGTDKPVELGERRKLPIYREDLRDGSWQQVEGPVEVEVPAFEFRCGNEPSPITLLQSRTAISWPITHSKPGLSRYRFAELGLVSNTFDPEKLQPAVQP